MTYSDNLGCRNRGLPHDLKILHENDEVKYEVCILCNKKFKWNKGYKNRIDNKEYLKVHVRNLAQPTGPTKRVFYKTYKQDETIIEL